jgi:hypothetical protein
MPSQGEKQMKMKTISVVLPFFGLALGFMSPMAQAQQTNTTGKCPGPSCPPNTCEFNGGCVPVKTIALVKGIPPVKGIPSEIASNLDQNNCLASCYDNSCELICRGPLSKESFEALTKEPTK